MGEYADAEAFDYDDLCPHGKIICQICAREENLDDEECEDEDE